MHKNAFSLTECLFFENLNFYIVEDSNNCFKQYVRRWLCAIKNDQKPKFIVHFNIYLHVIFKKYKKIAFEKYNRNILITMNFITNLNFYLTNVIPNKIQFSIHWLVEFELNSGLQKNELYILHGLIWIYLLHSLIPLDLVS